MKNKTKLLLFGIFGTHLLFLICLKFTAWPEMLLWPYLMVKGWLPYGNIAIAHTPFMFLKLAIFFKLFGVGILQLKIFTWILIILFDGLVFLITKKLWSAKIAIVATISFVFLQLFFEGNGLWFDMFMGFIALISFYFVQKKNWFLAGVFWALAFISKQTAVWFLIPVVWQVIIDKKLILRSVLRFTLGSLAVAAPFVFILWFTELLPDFYRWAINFGVFVLPNARGQINFPGFDNLIITGFPFLMFFPYLFATKGKKWALKLPLAVWAIAGGLGALPRFEYFHLQPAIPYLAFASGLVLSEYKKFKGFWKTFLIIYLAGSTLLLGSFFLRNWREGTRFYERDVQEVVTYIKNNTDANDKIFVLNWWDNVYALSDRLPSVNPWVPQLAWYMEIPGIQERMVSDLTISPPRLIIFYPYTASGLSSYVPPEVVKYIDSKYTLKEKVAGVQILEPKITE